SDLVNDSGFITSLPVHNHDDRYYTETETDAIITALRQVPAPASPADNNKALIANAGTYSWQTIAGNGFSGDYDDLSNKQTLFSGLYADLSGAPTLANVATPGSYNDLSDKPTIPTAPTMMHSDV